MVFRVSNYIVCIITMLFWMQTALAKEACTLQNDLYVCIEIKGPCDMAHLIPSEKGGLVMEIFRISITNRSNTRVLIYPQMFYAVTENGNALALDDPLYNKIEWKKKLKEKILGRMETVEGFLFFPSAMGRIQGLIYKGDPSLVINFF